LAVCTHIYTHPLAEAALPTVIIFNVKFAILLRNKKLASFVTSALRFAVTVRRWTSVRRRFETPTAFIVTVQYLFLSTYGS
jgi:hypothetical protein